MAVRPDFHDYNDCVQYTLFQLPDIRIPHKVILSEILVVVANLHKFVFGTSISYHTKKSIT